MRMRWWLTIGVMVLAAVGAACSSARGSTGQPTPTAEPEAVSTLPVIRFHRADGTEVAMPVEIADDDEERTCGLMHRTAEPDDQGMLFVFQFDSPGGFWMRNTRIPLSIAYIAADGTIVDILDMQPLSVYPTPPNVQPPIYTPRSAYRYAVEANLGWYAGKGIQISDKVDVADAVQRADAGTPPAICRQLGS
jgi:uncharacterized membrane protein (UPF0127 family)